MACQNKQHSTSAGSPTGNVVKKKVLFRYPFMLIWIKSGILLPLWSLQMFILVFM